jgi:hypothetical protein
MSLLPQNLTIATRRISELVRTKPSLFADLRKRCRSHLFAVMKTKREAWPPRPLQLPVRSDLLFERPARPQQCGVDALGLGRAPYAHAANRTRRASGTSSPLSIMSAKTWSAMVLTFRTASISVLPYAMTPGRSGTDARILPSSSRSVSTRMGSIVTMATSVYRIKRRTVAHALLRAPSTLLSTPP